MQKSTQINGVNKKEASMIQTSNFTAWTTSVLVMCGQIWNWNMSTTTCVVYTENCGGW